MDSDRGRRDSKRSSGLLVGYITSVTVFVHCSIVVISSTGVKKSIPAYVRLCVSSRVCVLVCEGMSVCACLVSCAYLCVHEQGDISVRMCAYMSKRLDSVRSSHSSLRCA